MSLKNTVTFFCILLALQLNAQQLLPFVENFTKSEYSGDNQVWNITQADDNTIYFANNHYFLRYNGVKWERYSLPNKTIIRSVFADGSRIYCGSYREFGYWERVKGIMQYTSLTTGKNYFSDSDNEEVWKIFKHADKIYFQTFHRMYAYDGKTIATYRFPSQISYCYVIDNTIYAASTRNGVYVFDGGKFQQITAWPELKDNIVHGMEKNGRNIYIFTKNNGVFKGDAKGVKPWDSNINSLLKNAVILSAAFINNNMLAIGTALKGIYIINLTDNSFTVINRNNALKNNAVLSVALDTEKDLWLGLDNGISHVEVNSPVSLFTDNSGLLGSVYSIAPTESGYLFASNHGVFSYGQQGLNTIPNSQGQAWDVYKSGDNYIIGHNDGTYTYNGQLKKANPVNGGWKFLKSKFDRAYFQANYSGIAVYTNTDNLGVYKTLDSIVKPIRNIAQTRPGELWAADSYRSLYRVLYDENFNVKRVENVSQKNNIKSDYGVKLFPFRGEVLFYINSKWYTYNSIKDKLEENKAFTERFSGISDIVPVDDDNFIIIRSGLLYLITRKGDKFSEKLLNEKYYQGRLIMENTQVYKNGSSLLINLDDGFMSYNIEGSSKKEAPVSIEAFYMGRLIDEDTHIKYNQSVELNVITGYYGYNRPDLFYRLNAEPLQPIIKGNIILNNLSSGNQSVDIYRNNNGTYQQVAAYNFKVSKPWYFSTLMILAYIAVISGIFFLYYRWNKVRYLQKIRLNEEELKHRREIMELELEAEKKLRQQEYEKHILEVEVQAKASEVAGKSLSIAKHSEMIESIQEALKSVTGSDELKTRISKIIKTNSISKNEWQSFEKNLVKSHEDFVSRLTAKYPALTPKDIKLCIYLKMNLSSKEIAPLMNISYRGVELHRYRLRKKLDISTEENLSQYMITI
ncbi:histidine kinase [Flavobacterium sp. D11R37]|uniref:helix-turn-helix and ligand-binding sensor domain-containing protein n=1 Tax=Flavobacterium coralii TaxID=2838017 RepID=UPI001CA684A3|nr:histidine kinase [Flavobacterium coralii]MBY8961833.1 histidine kinase [Flavobacterium coralii]